MLGRERRSKVLAKLTNARCELEDALHLDELKGVLRQIEGSQ
jgi:hypothetical protein